ncbi:cupredoxin domain-containing protein [Noviherbaspirillum sp.]|uniref:cupredoxin domain-containing protein n=1 Tax=Noviherbaspirillum sp. TaxID=1926288 RepID=UPI002FE37796
MKHQKAVHHKPVQRKRIRIVSAAMVVVAFGHPASVAFAHTGTQHDQHKANASVSAEEHAFGRQGDPKNAVRTITIDMADTMRFGPAEITVREGETVRFVVANKGKMMHEMVIGTMAELKAHGELMKKHPGMEHDEPYMAHVGPGRKAELVWHFTKAGEFHYACLVPGHFEAGMIGKIKVTK